MDDAEPQDKPYKPRAVSDNGERYPAPVAAWDVWFANRCHEAAIAKTEAAIEAAVETVRPYVQAQWCYPHRLETITAIARKRWNELNRANDRKKAAAGDA